MQAVRGFLISSIKFSDSDAVLHCYTKKFGFESFFLKNVFSRKNKKKPYLSPFNELDFYVSESQRSGSIRNVYRIESHEIVGVENDFKLNTILFFLVDFFRIVLKRETPSEAIYSEIQCLIEHLKDKKYHSHIVFMILLLNHLGHTPLVSEGTYLLAEEGEFSMQRQGYAFSQEVSNWWKIILQSNTPYEQKITSSLRKELIESIMIYYSFHVPEFKVPESLDIIRQIFE